MGSVRENIKRAGAFAPARDLVALRLEGEPETKLHAPGVVSLGVHDPKRRPRSNGRIDTEGSFRLSRRWIREDGVVEHVGDDVLEPQADSFCDMNVLYHSQVHVPVRQATEHAKATRVVVETENAGRRVLNRASGSEKMLNGPSPAGWSEAEPPEAALVRMQCSLVKKLEPSPRRSLGRLIRRPDCTAAERYAAAHSKNRRQ